MAAKKSAKEDVTTIAPAHKYVQLTDALWTAILDRIAAGESLNKICSTEDMPSRKTVFERVGKDVNAMQQYNLALSLRADTHAEELLTISDDGTNDTYTDDEGNVRVDTDVIARSKLRVDTRKWLISRMDPKKYGDKQTIDLNTPQMSDEQRKERLAELAKKMLVAGANNSGD